MEEKDTQNDNQGLLDELDVLRDKLQHAQKNEVEALVEIRCG